MLDGLPSINQMKCYRIDQCNNNIDYILGSSSITKSTIHLANHLSNKNTYHNFGHQVAVAKTALMIGITENCSINELNCLALVGLFHDAGHTGKTLPKDEENAFKLAIQSITHEQLIQLGITKEKFHQGIIATTFKMRGKYKGKLEKIIQDADMQSIGFGVNYMLYSDTQYIDEIGLGEKEFRKCQKEFIQGLSSINKDIFLSSGAKKVYYSPIKSLEELNNIDNETIEKAYDLRKVNITYKEFCNELNLEK